MFESLNLTNKSYFYVAWRNNIARKVDVFDSHSSFEEAYSSICDWWDKNNFDPKYIRFLERDEPPCIVIDYGNHTAFYDIHCSDKPLTKKQVKKLSEIRLPIEIKKV